MQEDFNLTNSILHLVVSAIGLLLTAKVINNVKVNGFISAFVASLILAFANSFIWPVFIFLTLPINILTLGLFSFVVNAAILKIAAALTPGFEVKGWLAAIFGSIFLSVFNMILHYVLI